MSTSVTVSEPGLMGDPGAAGRFGPFGGRFVPEALVPACTELEQEFRAAWADPGFRAELAGMLREYAGRPTPVSRAPRLSAELGVLVLLKREDLAHTGSHKINNVMGQALLARRLGKPELIAETGAGQHGVAAATVAARLGLGCTVFMGERDMARQELNVFRMELLGATVRPVRSGSRTLKDATSEALRHWVTTADSAHYCIGSVTGPHPYPWMVREFQRVIGDEARLQCARLLPSGRPDVVVACVGGGSNAAGTFAGFAATPARLVGVEAAGGAAASQGSPRRAARHAVLLPAGLPWPGPGGGIGLGRAGLPGRRAGARLPGRPRPGQYHTVTDDEAIAAAGLCARTEGILPALESAHAVAWVARAARTGELPAGCTVLITMSGRGDKDAALLRERAHGRG